MRKAEEAILAEEARISEELKNWSSQNSRRRKIKRIRKTSWGRSKKIRGIKKEVRRRFKRWTRKNWIRIKTINRKKEEEARKKEEELKKQKEELEKEA